LGKLCYRVDDLNSLKCLIAVRMTERDVEAEPIFVKDRKGAKSLQTSLTLANGSGKLTDPFAISWFLAFHDVKTGNAKSKRVGAHIMQWQAFSQSEIRPFLLGLIKDGHVNRRDLVRTNMTRKIRLIAAMDTLNKKMMEDRFLIGSKVTLADILLAVDLTPLLDAGWTGQTVERNVFIKDILRKDYAYIREWYRVVTSKTMFQNAVEQFLASGSYSVKKATPSVSEGEKLANEKDHSNSVVTNGEEKGVEGKKNKNHRGSTSRKDSSSSKGQRSGASDDKTKKRSPPPPKVDMSPLAEKPLRILCLHGYRQNDNLFREKLGAFRKMVGKYCQFTFVRAPHHVLPMSNEDINQDQRGWWFSRENDYFKADDVSDCDKGFDGSLELIQRTFDLDGPFDGVMGFSQGAALLTLLCLIKARNPELLSPSVKFDFAIMIASFQSVSSKHAQWYEKSGAKASIPTLHVMGTEDKVIKKALSEQLLDLFEEPSKLYHSGGHFVPATSKQKPFYFRFLHKVHGLIHPTSSPPDAAVAAEGAKAASPENKEETDENQNKGDSVSKLTGNKEDQLPMVNSAIA